MTADRQLLKRYADTLARVTHLYKLGGEAMHFRWRHPMLPVPALMEIYDANKARLAGQSSPAECAEAVRKVIDNA